MSAARILILGGTRFIGRHLVDEACARGHAVTVFHRGAHPLDGSAPQIESILGDRTGDLAALGGRTWDAVIDTCGYVPSVVAASARALSDRAGHYTFVSSVSVYADAPGGPFDESRPVSTMSDEAVAAAERLAVPADAWIAPLYGEAYGALKVRCERAAEAYFKGSVLNVRPGLVVGPLDYTDRFAYWPRRIAEGGELLAPSSPRSKIAVIDARDFAAFVLDAALRGLTGTFNATGRPALDFGALIDACLRATPNDARPIWVEERFLLDRGVEPWSELPLWLPTALEAHASIGCARAIGEGLRFRPLDETVRDTLAWEASRTSPRVRFSRDKERAILAEWSARPSS